MTNGILGQVESIVIQQADEVKRQHRLRAKVAIGAAFAVAGVGVTAYGPSISKAVAASTAQLTSVTILESTPGFFDVPVRVAAASFASKYHLKLNVITVQGGGSLGTEFEGGTGTVALVGVNTPILLEQKHAISGGISIIGTNMTHMLYALVAKKGSPYTNLASLKGKTVAITGEGAASQVVLNWALITKAHLSPNSVTEVPLGNPLTVQQGILSGSAVAGTVFSPALEEGLASGKTQITFDFRKYPFASNIFMARTSAIQKSPALFKDLMDAYNAAVNKLESDKSFALASAEKYYGQGVSPSVVKAELNFYLRDEWKGTTFPLSLYRVSSSVLVNSASGFSNATMPSYATLTKDTKNL